MDCRHHLNNFSPSILHYLFLAAYFLPKKSVGFLFETGNWGLVCGVSCCCFCCCQFGGLHRKTTDAGASKLQMCDCMLAFGDSADEYCRFSLTTNLKLCCHLLPDTPLSHHVKTALAREEWSLKPLVINVHPSSAVCYNRRSSTPLHNSKILHFSIDYIPFYVLWCSHLLQYIALFCFTCTSPSNVSCCHSLAHLLCFVLPYWAICLIEQSGCHCELMRQMTERQRCRL